MYNRKTSFFLLTCLLLIIIIFFNSLSRLLSRLKFERENIRYEICLELDEIKQISSVENSTVRAVLKTFKDCGVTAIALFPGESIPPFDTHIMDMISQSGMRIVVRPLNPVYRNDEAWKTYLLNYDAPITADMFLAAGDEAYGYPDKLIATARILDEKNIRPLWLEFGGQKGGKTIAGHCIASAIRSHSVDTAEMTRIPERKKLAARLIRAVRERGVRFLYIHLLPETGIHGNTAFIHSIVTELRNKGYVNGIPVMRTLVSSHNLTIRQICASAIALFIPVIAVLLGLTVISRFLIRGMWFAAFLICNSVSIIGGLTIASLLAVHPYMTGLFVFRGVKCAYLIPLVLLGIMLFWQTDWKHILERKVRWKEVLLLSGGCALIAVLLLRSGNYPFLFSADGIEDSIRHFLEHYLIARPRTKEFLFAQPALLYVLWLYKRNGFNSIKKSSVFFKSMLLGGMIGQISIINTFLHAHAPLGISLLRSVHGIWIGAIIGLGVIAVTQHK